MSEMPFMQMYWSDYFGDTRHLTCEQHGAYLQLIGTMWTAGGTLPADPRKLAKITGCTPSRWAKISPEVMAFFILSGDVITHKRVTFELEKAREKSIKRAEVGAKGGRAKALKNNEASLAIATDLLKHSPEPEPELDIIPPSTNVDVPPSGAKVKAVRGTRLPEDWEPSERDRMVARGEGLTEEDIDRAAREFRNYWCARSRDATRISWPRTWENRIIEIGERLRRDRARLASRPAVNGHGGSGVADFATIVAKRRGFAAE